MDRVLLAPPPPLPPLLSADGFIGRISPTVLLAAVILGSIFAISGLLHLLVRCLIRRSDRDQDYLDSATALQGQLQQLFHLHDAGVDQSFIDALPAFLYKDIAGTKEPFDCAVCLCEFEADEKLRLLPECSHAFHAECIDTWLLSHSTCPLCRTSLLPGLVQRRSCPPFVFLLESGGESSGEMGEEDPATSSADDSRAKSGQLAAEPSSRLVAIKLGKLKSIEAGGEGSGSRSRALDGRRCFSMGSFEYVMEETSLAHVTVKGQEKKPAISERDCSSGRPRESFSVSKIWLRSKMEKPPAENGSRRVFSFRLPLQIGQAGNDGKAKFCDKSAGELGYDLERGKAISRGEETPSFARRTLLWISGRNQKTGNHRSESSRISPSSCPFPISDFSGGELAGGSRRLDP